MIRKGNIDNLDLWISQQCFVAFVDMEYVVFGGNLFCAWGSGFGQS